MKIILIDNTMYEFNLDIYKLVNKETIIYVYPRDKNSKKDCYAFSVNNIKVIEGLSQEQMPLF